jgi:hypothetical protein
MDTGYDASIERKVTERVVTQQKFRSDRRAVSFWRAYLTLIALPRIASGRVAASRLAAQAHSAHPKGTADVIVSPAKSARLARAQTVFGLLRAPPE